MKKKLLSYGLACLLLAGCGTQAATEASAPQSVAQTVQEQPISAQAETPEAEAVTFVDALGREVTATS